MILRASAPSNIALIKYMGKSDPARNLPANPSLSMTLGGFRSLATVEAAPAERPSWDWTGEGLSEKERARALAHMAFVEREARARFAREGIRAAPTSRFLLSCVNDFPARAGVASSASSFAAMTLAAIGALDPDGSFRSRYASEGEARSWAAGLSRAGSGSSCRSFGGPFVRWDGEATRELSGALPPLMDLLLVIESGPKEVPSSEAHRRALASPLFAGRAERASMRCDRAERAIEEGDLRTLARAAWAESWEMHSLFHTADPPFTYFLPRTVEALRWFGSLLAAGEAPIVTMDAGPNVHVLVPEAEASEWEKRIALALPGVAVRKSAAGLGADWVR